MQLLSFAQSKTKTCHDYWMRDMNQPYQDFANRLEKALTDAGYTKERHKNLTHVLSKLFDVSISTVHDWRKGRKLPSMDSAIMLGMTLGVCVEWLLTGRGPRHPGLPDDDGIDEPAWRDLPQDARHHFAEALRAIADARGHYEESIKKSQPS